MNVLNFKFLFLTFPAEATILLRVVQFNSLKSFRDLSCGSTESILHPHRVLHHNFGTLLKLFLLTALAEHTTSSSRGGRNNSMFSATFFKCNNSVAAAAGLPSGLGTFHSCPACGDTKLELLSSVDLMKAYILISNDISNVIAYVFSLSEPPVHIFISARQDGVIASAKSVIV